MTQPDKEKEKGEKNLCFFFVFKTKENS